MNSSSARPSSSIAARRSPRHLLEQLNRQRCVRLRAGDFSRPGHESLDQQRRRHPILHCHTVAMPGIEDSGPVGEPDDRIVIIRQKSRGAGASGSGSGEFGTSNSSTPCSSLNVTRSALRRSTTSFSRVSPDHVWISRTDAGPYAARYRRAIESASGLGASGSPIQVSAVVCVARPRFPQTPRGGIWTNGKRARGLR